MGSLEYNFEAVDSISIPFYGQLWKRHADEWFLCNNAYSFAQTLSGVIPESVKYFSVRMLLQ